MTFHPTMVQAAHWLAGWIVLLEALNKLHRTDPFQPHLTAAQRIAGLIVLLTPWRWRQPACVTALKLFAWALMAFGAFGAVLAPFRSAPPPTLQEAAIACGFAVLIVRSRLKEGYPWNSLQP